MPNLGGGELLIVLVVVLIVFGAGKLPSVFSQLGRGLRSFREEVGEKPAPPAATPPDQTKKT